MTKLLTAVHPLGAGSSVIHGTSSGIEPVRTNDDWFYSRKTGYQIKVRDMKKNGQPSHDARVGDITEFGVIIALEQSQWSKETVAIFDREHAPNRMKRGISNKLINWSRLERVVTKLIEKQKTDSHKPVFKSMIKNLTLLWECSLDEAFTKCKNLADLEDALQKSKLKQKTIVRQTTDVKFGL